jgi:hypothetical protein
VTFQLQSGHHVQLTVHVTIQQFVHFLAAHALISPVAPLIWM